jgi:hypothetical protein
LEDWEEDALQQRLDELGMAFIEWNEFNELLKFYQFDTGEELLEDDYEERLELRLNVSYKDYVVGEEDWFNGMHSILTGENAEKAALSTCRKLYKNLKKRNVARWLDDEFGPKNDNDFDGNALGLWCNGKPPEIGYTDPKDVKWVYGEDRLPGNQ